MLRSSAASVSLVQVIRATAEETAEDIREMEEDEAMPWTPTSWSGSAATRCTSTAS